MHALFCRTFISRLRIMPRSRPTFALCCQKLGGGGGGGGRVICIEQKRCLNRFYRQDRNSATGLEGLISIAEARSDTRAIIFLLRSSEGRFPSKRAVKPSTPYASLNPVLGATTG